MSVGCFTNESCWVYQWKNFEIDQFSEAKEEWNISILACILYDIFSQSYGLGLSSRVCGVTSFRRIVLSGCNDDVIIWLISFLHSLLMYRLSFLLQKYLIVLIVNEKSAQRDANISCTLAVVRFGHRPPTTNTQTHRQDRLQYTAQLASAQCNDISCVFVYRECSDTVDWALGRASNL